MRKVIIILLGLAVLAYASNRLPGKTKLSRFLHLKGWQKIFGALAVILALLIVLDPEFLAFGLIGDTGFFDLLIFTLSLQIHMLAVAAFRSCIGALSRGVRWVGIPSPGMLYLLSLLMISITCAGDCISESCASPSIVSMIIRWVPDVSRGPSSVRNYFFALGNQIPIENRRMKKSR